MLVIEADTVTRKCDSNLRLETLSLSCLSLVTKECQRPAGSIARCLHMKRGLFARSSQGSCFNICHLESSGGNPNPSLRSPVTITYPCTSITVSRRSFDNIRFKADQSSHTLTALASIELYAITTSPLQPPSELPLSFSYAASRRF